MMSSNAEVIPLNHLLAIRLVSLPDMDSGCIRALFAYAGRSL